MQDGSQWYLCIIPPLGAIKVCRSSGVIGYLFDIEAIDLISQGVFQCL